MTKVFDATKFRKSITKSIQGLGIGFADPTEPVSHTYKNGRHWDGFSGRWNVLLMRYADIILLRAEALNQIGQTAQAITYLNQVRARVKLAPTTASSQSEVALAILKKQKIFFIFLI